MKIIYFAAPLFTMAERRFNEELVDAIQAGYDNQIGFIMPQKFGGSPAALYSQCLENLKICDEVVAMIDGAEMDAGTAFEIGVATAIGKKVIAVRTDFRKSGDMPNNSYANLMIGYAVTTLIVAIGRGQTVKDVGMLVREAIMPGISTYGVVGD